MSLLGIVTYNIAKDWDLPTIIRRLEKLEYEGVELRTSHAHKVEVNLSPLEREEVRKRFDDSPVNLAGLGSAFEFHSANPDEVKHNIAGTKEYVRLAHDVGAPGVKVRPNGVPKGADMDATFRQIAKALDEVGRDAADFGVEIRVEVHGSVTSEPAHFARILSHVQSDNVFACWNSNPGDVKNGSIAESYGMIGPKIREVHLRDLTDEAYPWRDLFGRLKHQGYEGYTLAEIGASTDPERVLRYFRSLWLAYQPKPEPRGKR